ncbi:MAG: hypothetical protein J6S67_03690 [Methanobrevibacter sp.]|nr:hypothetical protein [Methanobrevibacter sp.]
MAKLSIAQLNSVVANYVASNKIAVESFSETRANSVALLDTLGKIYTLWQNYGDKLALFDGEDLSFGKTIEEWAQDLILPEDFDASGSTTLAPHESTYRPVSFSYTLGKKTIPQTIRNNDIERAVHNIAQFEEIIAGKTKALYDSETMFRYALKRQALGVLIERCADAMDSTNADVTLATEGTTISGAVAVNELVYVTATTTMYVAVKPIASGSGLTGTTAIAGGYLIALDLVTAIAQPVSDVTGEAFIEQVLKDVEVASDFSEGHSLNGNTLGGNPEAGLVLVMKQGIMPSLKVQTLAGAFHREELAIPAEIVVVPNFGDADDDYYAVLVDRRIMRLHNTYRAVRENMNGQGDFLNMFYHTENTVHVSRNCFVKVYCKPSA